MSTPRGRHNRRARGGALAALALGLLAVAVAVIALAPRSPDRPQGAGIAPRAGAPARPTVRARRHRRHGLPPAPVAVRGAAARRARIPILMYHVIAAAGPGTPNPQLWVPAPAFRRQMLALRRAGYRAISLRQAYEAWHRGGGLPRRPVVVSFDDGYLSHYTHARPVLRSLGWPGVLNLTLENVGPGGLTPREVRRLIAAGWEIDSHTLTHPDLTTLGPAALRREVAGSRRALRRRFGVAADFFCYPSGRFDARVAAAVEAAGYRAATTTAEGTATAATPFTLPRVRVNGGDSPAAVLAKLRG